MVEQQPEGGMPQRTGDVCAHHWQIETPNGETSEGICKLCGATRTFANYNPRRPMSRTVKSPASGSALS